MNNSTYLLFDLDGTLTDPGPGIVGSMAHAIDRLGLKVEEDLHKYIGPPLHETFRCILQTMDQQKVDEAIGFYRERFGTIGIFENELYAGIPEVLSAFADQGYQLRVATSKPKVYADIIIDHFELRPWFPMVYGAEMDGQRSDKSELIGHLLDEEGIDRDSTSVCMIGDRKHDILGAKAHGLGTIGVTWGYGTGEELEKAEPDAVIDSVDELPRAIAEWRGISLAHGSESR